MLKVHHIGYLVEDINVAIDEFVQLGYKNQSELFLGSDRQVNVIFMEKDGYVIELVSPTGENSPIYGLKKKYKNSPYHICYCTDNLDLEIEKLGTRYTLISPPQTAPGIAGSPRVAFLYSLKIGMIELVEAMASDG